ncbi:MAG TPA: hypothetical protein VJ464_19170 [Blastocatellia bacterium]|nr:hypothetical protein [Blastocatellia bacterium]
MKRVSLRLILLSLAAAMLMSSLPSFTTGATTVQLEPQRPVVRRPAARRRAPRAAPVVPIGTNLRVRLNDDLSSKDSRVGDRFTAAVVNPSRYEGATLRGHIRSIRKSGTVQGRTTMTLAFDSIDLREARGGALHGQVVRIYDADSDSSKVDEEGRVQSGSRGKQAIKRGGIGAVAGAIIGGIAGGGKGAAIGLIVGGAGGAGSLAVQGSKELKLERGTEMLVRITR